MKKITKLNDKLNNCFKLFDITSTFAIMGLIFIPFGLLIKLIGYDIVKPAIIFFIAGIVSLIIASIISLVYYIKLTAQIDKVLTNNVNLLLKKYGETTRVKEISSYGNGYKITINGYCPSDIRWDIEEEIKKVVKEIDAIMDDFTIMDDYHCNNITITYDCTYDTH